MTLEQAQKRYPALAEALTENPGSDEKLTRLLEIGMTGIFEKYLRDSDKPVWSRFLCEVRSLDIEHLQRHRAALFSPETEAESAFDPVKADVDQRLHEAEDRHLGLESLREGLWAVCVFAGGAGTRFVTEWDQISNALPDATEWLKHNPPHKEAPKGMFPITPIEGFSFFQCFLAQCLETGIASSKLPPALFMTSRVTHTWTERWLSEVDLWGMPKEAIFVFRQGEIPRLDPEGDLIVQPDGTLFWTGDGHGGVYRALLRQTDEPSVAEHLKALGVSQLVMGNVDNAALSPLKPDRLGFHLRKRSAFTMSVVTRSDPTEKVGMICRSQKTGKVEVIEYSVLDPALSSKPDPRGGLLFDAAHINTNLLALDAVRTDLPGTLYKNKPVEVAGKKISSSTFEQLNQHLAGLLPPESVAVYEAKREQIFLPTKAVVGRDSVESTYRELMHAGQARFLRLGGVLGESADGSVIVEFHPCLGTTDEEVVARGVGQGWILEAGCRLYLGVRHGLGGARPYGTGLSLGRGAWLILRATRPYGRIQYDHETREIREDAASAARVRIGDNVRLAPGVHVVINLHDDASFEIPAGTRITKDTEITFGKGEKGEIF